ncbi:hypothetical protein MHI02_03815 [Oceanobacillus sp. FSL K6-0118]|uniref:hypothetical protein n=1 Tax=Oceanobacillus sp. FSL K6-0118 TaxID=2921418 RepID=UPI0030FD1F5A
MVKKSLIPALIFFIVFTAKNLIFDKKIEWAFNITIFIVVFFIYILWEWSKRPYNWNKNK